MPRALAPSVVVLALVVGGAAGVARAGKAVDGVVNLNTAPPEILSLLPGVGPAKAAEIAGYRKKRPFRTVDELVRIKGIGRKMVRRLRVHLAVAGPTTARALAGVPAPPPAPAPAAEPKRPGGMAHPGCPKPPVAATPRAVRRVARERWPSHGACLAPR
jgi:competence protein ComEA